MNLNLNLRKLVLWALLVLIANHEALADKIPISVTKFTNKSAHNPNDQNCYGWMWFSADPGQALQERAIESLQTDPRFEVLERETIHKIATDEVNLENSEKTEAIPKGHFKKAKYTIVGAVKTLEFCNSKSSGSLNVGKLFGFGNLDVGLKKQSSVVEVTLRLINTKTGAVVSTSTGESHESQTGLNLSGEIKNLDFSTKAVRDSSLGKAIDEAVNKGVIALMTKM